jgi:hypothetical protein
MTQSQTQPTQKQNSFAALDQKVADGIAADKTASQPQQAMQQAPDQKPGTAQQQGQAEPQKQPGQAEPQKQQGDTAATAQS